MNEEEGLNFEGILNPDVSSNVQEPIRGLGAGARTRSASGSRAGSRAGTPVLGSASGSRPGTPVPVGPVAGGQASVGAPSPVAGSGVGSPRARGVGSAPGSIQFPSSPRSAAAAALASAPSSAPSSPGRAVSSPVSPGASAGAGGAGQPPIAVEEPPRVPRRLVDADRTASDQRQRIRRKSIFADTVRKFHQEGPRSIQCFKRALLEHALAWSERFMPGDEQSELQSQSIRNSPEGKRTAHLLGAFASREQWFQSFVDAVGPVDEPPNPAGQAGPPPVSVQRLVQLAQSVEFPFGHYVILCLPEGFRASDDAPLHKPMPTIRRELCRHMERLGLPVVQRNINTKNDIIREASRPAVQFDLSTFCKGTDAHCSRGTRRPGRRAAQVQRVRRRYFRRQISDDMHEDARRDQPAEADRAARLRDCPKVYECSDAAPSTEEDVSTHQASSGAGTPVAGGVPLSQSPAPMPAGQPAAQVQAAAPLDQGRARGAGRSSRRRRGSGSTSAIPGEGKRSGPPSVSLQTTDSGTSASRDQTSQSARGPSSRAIRSRPMSQAASRSRRPSRRAAPSPGRPAPAPPSITLAS